MQTATPSQTATKKVRDDLNRRFEAAIEEAKRDGFISLDDADRQADELLRSLVASPTLRSL